jgi:hypothetical protein
VVSVRSFLDIRKDASTADIVSLILFDTSARIVCRAMPLADCQSKLGDFLKMQGGGTSFGPALLCALNVIKEVHQQTGYTPLLMFMSDGGSSDGEAEMVSFGRSFPLQIIYLDRLFKTHELYFYIFDLHLTERFAHRCSECWTASKDARLRIWV